MDGREFNLSLLANGSGAEVLPPAEMVFVDYPPGKERVLGYRAKWVPDGVRVFAHGAALRLPAGGTGLIEQMKEIARRCWALFDLHGYARVDLRVDEDSRIFVLEINANPCLDTRCRVCRGRRPRGHFAGADGATHFGGSRVCAAAASINLTLRDELIPADRAPLEHILRACKFFRDDEIAVALELIDDRLGKGKDSEYHFLVAINNEKLVGYCCYGRIPCTVHSFDLYWIVVDPALHRGGIGRKLVAAVEERVRELGRKAHLH